MPKSARRPRGLLSCAAIGALVCSSAPVYAVDPATVITVAQTARMILAAGANSSGVDGAMQIAQLESLKAVHSRLDAIESTLAEIVTQVSDLPEVIRGHLVEEFDRIVIGDLRGTINSVAQMIDDGVDHDSVEFRIARNELARYRNILFERSDLAAPAIIQAFAFEGELCREISCTNWDGIAKVYRDRFEAMLNPNRTGSMAWTYQNLVETQAAAEASIMLSLTGGTDSELQSGKFPWFTYVTAKKEVRYIDRWCPGLGPDRPVMDACPEQIEVDKDLVIDRWYRSLAVEEIDEVVPARRLSLSETNETEKRGRQRADDEVKIDTYETGRKRERHWSDFRASKTSEYRALEGGIALYNARAEYLVDLSTVMGMVLVSRSASEDGPARIEAAIGGFAPELIGRESAIESESRRQRAAHFTSAMFNARQEAWDTINASLENIRQAQEEFAKDAWRRELMGALDLVAQGMRLYQAINTEIARRELDMTRKAAVAIAKGEARPGSLSSGEPQVDNPGSVDPSQSEPGDNDGNAGDGGIPAELVHSDQEFSRILLSTPDNRANAVLGIIKGLETLDPDSDEYGRQVQIGMAIMSTIDREVDGVISIGGDAETTVGLVGEVVKQVFRGSPSAVSAFLAASSPSSTASYDLSGGLGRRNIIRGEMTAIYMDYLNDKIPEFGTSSPISTESILEIREQRSRCLRYGCIGPAP